jgi:hypothetical protein
VVLLHTVPQHAYVALSCLALLLKRTARALSSRLWGIALVGAVSVVEEAGSRFYNLAGTSGGATVVVLLGAGYSAEELKSMLMELDFKKLVG